MRRSFLVAPGLAVLVLLLALLPAAASFGIVIRHDKSDFRYRVEAADYPQLFFLHTRFGHKVCVATLISPRWALTAAHCAQQTPLLETFANHEDFPLVIAGQSYRVENLVLHPDFDTGDEMKNTDLALIGLDRDVAGVTPAGLYRDRDEANRVFELLGWGFTGIGTLGMSSNDGNFRRAENRVVKAGQWLEFLFDDPRAPHSQALALEGVPGLGDSGGPALLETDDGLVLAGIAVGELEEGKSPEHQGLYGTVQLYERVSSHLDWIDDVIGR